MDRETLDFYQARSAEWAAAVPHGYSPELDEFLDQLAPGARILELGCGDGRDAERMIARGFDVHPSDGTPAMALLAGERIRREVPVMRFEELDAEEEYDAVWCHASLLHADRAELPGIVASIYRALKPGGWHFANFKAGEEGHRDEFGRYYNYMSENALRAAYEPAGPWSSLELESFTGGTFGGGAIPWIRLTARR